MVLDTQNSLRNRFYLPVIFSEKVLVPAYRSQTLATRGPRFSLSPYPLPCYNQACRWKSIFLFVNPFHTVFCEPGNDYEGNLLIRH